MSRQIFWQRYDVYFGTLRIQPVHQLSLSYPAIYAFILIPCFFAHVCFGAINLSPFHLIFLIVGIILKGEDARKTCTYFLKMKDEKKKECFGDKSISVSEMSRLSQWSYALRQVQINEWAVCW